MDSQGNAVQEPNEQSLCRQHSFYNLTLDEVQQQLGGLGKPLGSMNLDEFIETRQDNMAAPQQQSNQRVEFQVTSVQQSQPQAHQHNMATVFIPGQKPRPVLDLMSGDSRITQAVLLGMLPDTPMPGRKRDAAADVDVVEEKTVERRQKRMMKNRESAARSRARRQAYTHELEIKVSHLEEENERLRRTKVLSNVDELEERSHHKYSLGRNKQLIFMRGFSHTYTSEELLRVQFIKEIEALTHTLPPESKRQLRRIHSATF